MDITLPPTGSPQASVAAAPACSIRPGLVSGGL